MVNLLTLGLLHIRWEDAETIAKCGGLQIGKLKIISNA